MNAGSADSTVQVESLLDEGPDLAEDADGHTGWESHAPQPVAVRRNAVLSLVVSAAASALAIAYLGRAIETMAVLDWVLCALLALLAVFHLATLVDSRAPLVVADDLGVRVRFGRDWRGVPWGSLDRLVVVGKRHPLADGLLVLVPHDLGHTIAGLDRRARRRMHLAQRLYGAPLAVPLGWSTRVSSEGPVADALIALAADRTDVVVVTEESRERFPDDRVTLLPPRQPESDEAAEAEPPAVEESDPEPEFGAAHVALIDEDQSDDAAADPEDVAEAGRPEGREPTDGPAGRRTFAEAIGGIGHVVSRVSKRREEPSASQAADAPDLPHAPAAELPPAKPATRVEVTRETPATLGSAALQPDPGDGVRLLPEGDALRRTSGSDLFEPTSWSRESHLDRSNVRPIATPGAPVPALVLGDFETRPAYDPVIGPQLAAARTRLGLSVDELADRTRIRPHVIESIEVDDFAPCGGDFYTRGHLRTLARVLGQDLAPILETFEARYATAPVNARRVFEAELATGMTGSMRSTRGGPHWGLLIAVVLTLVVIWGAARLFVEPPQELTSPAPLLGTTTGVQPVTPQPTTPVVPAAPVRVTVTAARAAAVVTVRDADGRVVWSGPLALGEQKRLRVRPPLRVVATDGGAVEVSVDGSDRGVVGVSGSPGARRFDVER